MDTMLIDNTYFERGIQKSLIDQNKLFCGILKDPKLCRHLLLSPHVAAGGNENHLSFIGYLKKLIMSRETSLQLKSVKGILSALIGCKSKDKSRTFREEKFIMAKLLDNDFVEFMCEALPCPTATSADDLIQDIFRCLALFSGEDAFYHHFHAYYALDSILRILHFVCEALLCVQKALHNELHILSTGLALIAIILEGSINKCSVLDGGCKTVDGGSILERIFYLLTKSMSIDNPSIKWKSGLVVRSLLNFWHLGKFFSPQTQKMQQTFFGRNRYSPAQVVKDGETHAITEICRKTSFYHKGVQLIQRKSSLQYSSMCTVQNHDDSLDEPDPLHVKEINLVIKLIRNTIKLLVDLTNNLLKSQAEMDMKMMNQYLLLICQIGKNALRLLPQGRGVHILENKIPQGNKTKELIISKGSQWQDVLNAVSQSIGELCASHLVEIEFNKNSHKIYKECLSCLELLYQKTKDFSFPLSHKLATKGYLTLLPYLLTFDDHCSTDYLHDNELCMVKSSSQVVLTHLLAALTKTELSWADSFSVLSKGLLSLPKNISTWPSVIASQSCQPASTTMIIFSYFYFLSSSRPDVAIPFLMPLVSFMKDIVPGDGTSKRDIPSPILKALWFSFATSYLSNECPKDSKIEDATHGLMNCIYSYHLNQKNKGLKDIFTYHPAILLWAFSSPVKNQWIQLHVVLMWLEGCQSSKSSIEVEQVISTNKDVLICLLSIAENGSREVMECAMRTIWNFLQDARESMRKEFSFTLWEILIYVVKRYNAVENALEKEMRALNVGCLMQLTQATSVREPNSTTVLRLACLLNSTLALKHSDSYETDTKKNYYILYLSGLRMLHFLLKVSLKNGDTRVAYSMLRHSGQLKRLEWAASLCPLASHYQNRITSNEQENLNGTKYLIEDLNLHTFSIMSSLLHIDENSQSTVQHISLNSWHLLKAISSNHQDVSISSLKLFNSLIEIHLKKSSMVHRPLVQIVDAGKIAFSSATFVRMLYLQILMLSARAPPDMEKYYWEFLNLALQLPDKNLSSHLSKLPWNNSLILSRLVLYQNHTSVTGYSNSHRDLGLSTPFLCFLHQWLANQYKQDNTEWRCYRRTCKKKEPRRVGCIIFQQVLNSITKALTSDECAIAETEDGGLTSQREMALLNLMLLVNEYEKDLPSELSQGLRKKLSTISKNLHKIKRKCSVFR